MRRIATILVAVLAALVVVGVVVQVYLIASYIFGAADALDAHRSVGWMVHLAELLALVAALVAFWRRWPLVLRVLALPVIGTIQIAFSGGDRWVGGIHGMLALAVIGIAAHVVMAAVRELRRAPGLA